jgi:hypothetical protein
MATTRPPAGPRPTPGARQRQHLIMALDPPGCSTEDIAVFDARGVGTHERWRMAYLGSRREWDAWHAFYTRGVMLRRYGEDGGVTPPWDPAMDGSRFGGTSNAFQAAAELTPRELDEAAAWLTGERRRTGEWPTGKDLARLTRRMLKARGARPQENDETRRRTSTAALPKTPPRGTMDEVEIARATLESGERISVVRTAGLENLRALEAEWRGRLARAAEAAGAGGEETERALAGTEKALELLWRRAIEGADHAGRMRLAAEVNAARAGREPAAGEWRAAPTDCEVCGEPFEASPEEAERSGTATCPHCFHSNPAPGRPREVPE